MSATTTGPVVHNRARDLDHSSPAASRAALGSALKESLDAIAELQTKYDALVAAGVAGTTARTLPVIQPLQGGTRKPIP